MSTLIQPVAVPMFKVANNLDEAMSVIKAELASIDPNKIHALVMMYHNSLLAAVCASRKEIKHD